MYDSQIINKYNSILDVMFYLKIYSVIKLNAKSYGEQMFLQF